VFEALADTILALTVQYGYIVFFLFMFCETSMTFPLAPSEIVVPAAAGLLVTGPASFIAFVLAGTAGATVGSLFAYYVIGATSHEVLDRYGRYVRVSERDVDRARYWFRRWGESSVFWGRLLPVLRSLISIPAGFADMNVRKFVVYSAVGSAIATAGFAAIGVLVLESIITLGLTLFEQGSAILMANPSLLIIVLGLLVALCLVAWRMAKRMRWVPE
jgi:membrane protein DedA with SNARE-associated domain